MYNVHYIIEIYCSKWEGSRIHAPSDRCFFLLQFCIFFFTVFGLTEFILAEIILWIGGDAQLALWLAVLVND